MINESHIPNTPQLELKSDLESLEYDYAHTEVEIKAIRKDISVYQENMSSLQAQIEVIRTGKAALNDEEARLTISVIESKVQEIELGIREKNDKINELALHLVELDKERIDLKDKFKNKLN